MRTAILCVLLTCSTLLGAPPEVPKEPVTGVSGETLFFDVKGESGKVAFAPGFDVTKCRVVRLHSDDPSIMSYMAFPKKDGEFYMTFWTQGEKAYNQVILRSGDYKKVDPSPKPEPNLLPVKVESLWVVVVEDTKAVRTIEVAKMLNDPFWLTLAPKHEFRHYLNTSDTAKESGYVAEAEKTGVGYPAVILIDGVTGKKIKSFWGTGIDSIKSEVGKVTK